MEAFVKSFATYRTIGPIPVISHSLILDALEEETSTITIPGNAIAFGNVGDWLICEGQLFCISNVKPAPDKTVLTLKNPLDAFRRPLELEGQPGDQTVGGFVAQQLQRHWAVCDDPDYAVPYLAVSNSDTTPFVPPELDSSGSFTLPDYVRLMRKTYRTTVHFTDGGKQLLCTIHTAPAAAKQISFEDGRSQLVSATYSSSGLAKITALHDIDTGEKDADGNAILIRERTNWYLTENGEISQEIPARRAIGEWGQVHVKSNDDVAAKVAETFAKNKKSHKLEFWSRLDLPVQTDCTFLVYGQLLRSHISYKRKSSADSRYYYKSGELATTATEKLKGALK